VAWSHTLTEEADGTYRVELIDEEGVTVPIARQVTKSQAEALVKRVAAECEATGKPMKAVIRDPYFMAATVITVKRLAS
jgi:hypothetical protein